MPFFWQVWYSSIEPNRLPWSVSASDFCPSATQAATRSPMRFAPSSRLYSECTCRWTNSGALMAGEQGCGSAAQQFDQQRLLRVQAILGLLVEQAARTVEQL